MQNTSGTALDLSTAAPACAETATATPLLLDKNCSQDEDRQLELEASSIAIVTDDAEEHESEPGTPQLAVMPDDDVKLETGIQLDDEEAAPKEAVETFAERPCVESRGVVSVKWDVTRKNKASVVIDGYKMTESRSGKDGRVFWRCSKRFCPATAISVGSRLLSVRRVDAGRFHSHPPAGQEEFFAGHFLAPGTPTEVTVKWPVSRGLGGAGAAAAVRGSPAKRQRRLASEGGLGGGGEGAAELLSGVQQETKVDPDAAGTPTEHRRLGLMHQHHQLYRRRHGQMQRPRFHGGQRRDRSEERHEQLAQPPQLPQQQQQQPQQQQQHPQFLLNATAGDPLDSATEDSPPPMKREAGAGVGGGGGFVGSGLDCGRLGNPDFLSLLQAAAAYQQQLQQQLPQQLQPPAQLPAHLQRHFQGQPDPMLFATAAQPPQQQQQQQQPMLQQQPPLLQQQSPLLQQQQQQLMSLSMPMTSSSLSMPMTSSSLSMSLTSSAVELLQQQPIDNGQLVRQLRRLEAYFRAGIAGLSDAMCRVGTSADERESLGRLFSYMDGLGRVQRLAAELS